MNQEQLIKHHKHAKVFIILFIGLLIAAGSAICGWFIANGLYHIKMADKYVSVKGLAEKQVKADLAIWNISFKVANNDLQQAIDKTNADQKIITDFLAQHGVSSDEIKPQQTTIVDQYASEYSSGNKPQNRYIISSSIKVRTNKVDLIKQISGLTSDLIAKGIILNKDYSANPRYLFTKLDSIRPSMLEQATKSATLVAEQFAINSHSQLGHIKHASQGVFQILSIDRDSGMSQESSVYKIVRIVSSIDYFLVN